MISEKIAKLKKLPNTYRGTASSLSTAFCFALFLIGYFVLDAVGVEISTTGFVAGVVLAEIVATAMYFAWVDLARKMKEEES